MTKIIKHFLRVWLPYLAKKPKRIKYFSQWLFSFRFARDEQYFLLELPAMGFEVVEWLDKFLTKDMKVFEWGSGGSTLFVAKRVKELISVEHDPHWFKRVSERLGSNCKYLFEDTDEYSQAINNYPDNYFDLVLVDGKDGSRVRCVFQALRKVLPGGYLLLDDTENQQYIGGVKLLEGWKRKNFAGPKLFKAYFYQTSIWQKPAL